MSGELISISDGVVIGAGLKAEGGSISISFISISLIVVFSAAGRSFVTFFVMLLMLNLTFRATSSSFIIVISSFKVKVV